VSVSCLIHVGFTVLRVVYELYLSDFFPRRILRASMIISLCLFLRFFLTRLFLVLCPLVCLCPSRPSDLPIVEPLCAAPWDFVLLLTYLVWILGSGSVGMYRVLIFPPVLGDLGAELC